MEIDEMRWYHILFTFAAIPFVITWIFLRHATEQCGVLLADTDWATAFETTFFKWYPYILVGLISGCTAMALMWAISYYFDLV